MRGIRPGGKCPSLAQEKAMPIETMIVLAGVVSAFAFFAFVLERASRQTQEILRARKERG
jgi:multisubunit Na+/H+ antiporter MnhC subunit